MNTMAELLRRDYTPAEIMLIMVSEEQKAWTVSTLQHTCRVLSGISGVMMLTLGKIPNQITNMGNDRYPMFCIHWIW
jgi:hypothetical protein